MTEHERDTMQAEPAHDTSMFLDKAHIRRSSEATRRSVLENGRRAFIYSSGGTTGEPTFSYIPEHMFIPDVLRLWRPLEPHDVFCNAFTPGRLWVSHYFYHALGSRSAALTVNYGSALKEAEIVTWTQLMNHCGVTALAATPSVLGLIFECWKRNSVRIDTLRKVLWNGEAFGDKLAALVGEVLPGCQLYGMYGSAETWVVGVNFPGCPRNYYHLLPYQQIRIQQDRISVTCTHPDVLNPIRSYLIGDCGAWVRCPCGRDQAGTIRLDKRFDQSFMFRGHSVYFDNVHKVVAKIVPDSKVQMLVHRNGEPDMRIEVRVDFDERACPVTSEDIRGSLLCDNLDFANTLSREPELLEVTVGGQFYVNPRTGKTPSVAFIDN